MPIFEGIRVVAVTRIVAAPFATYQLALHGADVITIEHPQGGDSFRHAGDVGTALPEHAMCCGYLAHASNKKSVTLNISTPEGQAIFRRFASQADIVVENLRAGDMAKYGLDYEGLRKENPRLIYCSVTGYGQTGPKRRDPAIDGTIQAASGMMWMTGTPESGPLKTGFTMVDYATGYAAAMAIVSALYHRERTGKGQYIDVSMLETAFTMMSTPVTRAITTGETPPLCGNGNANGSYISNTFRCKEGVLMISASAELRRQRLYAVLGRDFTKEPAFATPALCRKNLRQLEAEIENLLSTRTALEWEELLNKAGVSCMCVRTIPQAVSMEQVESRSFFHQHPHDEQLGASIRVPRASYHLSEGEAAVHSPPPRLGEHTDECLAALGCSAEDILKWRELGVI